MELIHIIILLGTGVGVGFASGLLGVGGGFIMTPVQDVLFTDMGMSADLAWKMAVGTSLPEIATVIAASMKGYSDIITGNAIGSNIFNLLCVLGLTSLILPLSLGAITRVDLWVFVGAAVLICIAFATRQTLSRFEGLLMLAGYAAYVVYLY